MSPFCTKSVSSSSPSSSLAPASAKPYPCISEPVAVEVVAADGLAGSVPSSEGVASEPLASGGVAAAPSCLYVIIVIERITISFASTICSVNTQSLSLFPLNPINITFSAAYSASLPDAGSSSPLTATMTEQLSPAFFCSIMDVPIRKGVILSIASSFSSSFA